MTLMHPTILDTRHHWLITGVAGFIGSNLLENLIQHDQTVTGLDNFLTGSQANIDAALQNATPEQRQRFRLIQGDIADPQTCIAATTNVDFVLHQAAIGSVPWSMDDPLRSHTTNVTGFLNVLMAAQAQQVKRVVYASSSAVYGDSPEVPNREDRLGQPLSPYAATKHCNEVYAAAWHQAFHLPSIGLRYFNVFGPRQDPNGPYAAVIPRWIDNLCHDKACLVFGDGETTRDFCYVDNVVHANITAALCDLSLGVFNIAGGEATSLNTLFHTLRDAVAETRPAARTLEPVYQDFRPGDIRHSMADIRRAQTQLGYHTQVPVKEGLRKTVAWALAQR